MLSLRLAQKEGADPLADLLPSPDGSSGYAPRNSEDVQGIEGGKSLEAQMSDLLQLKVAPSA